VKGENLAGWLPPGDTARFHSYEELVHCKNNRRTYLTADWDGQFRDAPGFDQKAHRPALPEIPEEERHPDVRCMAEVTASRIVKGQLWFRTRLILPEYDSMGTPMRGACGWVPAYDTQGERTMWFFAKGC
jgi:hypothetical protein